MVPSYNTDKDFHPKKNGWLGFIVEIEGIKIYHAGDADFIPRDEGPRGRYRASAGIRYIRNDRGPGRKAALAINPNLAIPMHYAAIVGDVQDALNFQKALEGKSTC